MNVSHEVKQEIAECRASVEDDIKKWLDEHEKEEFAKYADLKNDILSLQTQVAEIARLFEQGKGALTVIKWLSAVVVAIWAFALWAKDHIKL